MGLFGVFKKSIRDLYIARPDSAAYQLIWRLPQQSIPSGCKLTVRSDEVAIFFREGRFAGQLEAGAYTLETENIPFLSELFVSGLTGSNAYICEIFFVRTAEFIHDVPSSPLGTYTDMESRHVVTFNLSARFAVRVTDALALITQLGGQSAGSAEVVRRFLSSRIRSLTAAAVGQVLSQQPALAIASSGYNESLGQLILQSARNEFAESGLVLSRFLDLSVSLDAESEAALRDFGRKRAELNIEREGAEIAGDFTTYHVAKGHRSALEGIGMGLARGLGTPVIGLGGIAMPSLPTAPLPPNLRTALATGTAPVFDSAAIGRSPPPGLPGMARFLLRTDSGVEGPYTVRQVALRVMSLGVSPGTALVRPSDGGEWTSLPSIDCIRREFERRQIPIDSPGPKAITSGSGASRGGTAGPFDTLLASALSDGYLSTDELGLLVQLALVHGSAADEASARELILARARAAGCRVEGG